jgi:2-isopropylmalate synthase
MLRDPSSKYRPFPQVNLPGRQWPSRTITKAPALAVDRHARRQPGADRSDGRREEDPLLRPAGQDRDQGDRGRLPSAGATEFDFISGLVQNGKIPDDVIVQVLTQSRPT